MARTKIKDLPKDMKMSRHEMRKILGGSQLMGSDLFSEISNVENSRDELRNTREVNMTLFENANQKATQYINMLSSVLKTMKEMESSIIRNTR